MSYNAQFVEALKEALNGLRTIHSVGEEWVSYLGKIPVGGVPYCGQEVTRSTYSALWQYAQNQGLVKSESEWQSIYSAQGGNVPYYSSGNGSTTFRMPRLVGYVRGASSQSESGSYVAEGLPNIEGSLTTQTIGFKAAQVSSNGCVVVGGAKSGTVSTAAATGYEVNLDASASNPIYGNSSHVTPETSVVLFGVYAFGEVNNVDALDAGTLASALARVESNMVDKTSAHIVETWRSGDSWHRKYSDGWIEQGGITSSTVANGITTVSLPTAFSTTDYIPLVSHVQDTSTDDWPLHVQSFTTTSFGIRNTGAQTLPVRWYACGY